MLPTSVTAGSDFARWRDAEVHTFNENGVKFVSLS